MARLERGPIVRSGGLGPLVRSGSLGLLARLGAVAATLALGLRAGSRVNRLGAATGPEVAEDPSGRGAPGVPASARSRRSGHETQDMSGGLMVRLAVTLGVVAIVMISAMIGFRTWVRGAWIAGQPQYTALQTEAQRPPAPTLQANPVQEWDRVRAAADALLANYAWADPAQTRARIPIGRAMTLTAGQGMGPPP